MKIITYNVNGIRAALKKDFLGWIESENPAIFCLQEVKAMENQVPELEIFKEMGYEIYWNPAEKKGYSGVATFTKIKPISVTKGIGLEKYDSEGRVLKLTFENFTLINSYFPSGSSGDLRQAFKMNYLADFQKYIDELKKTEPNLVICGDVNIVHLDMDIHNPTKQKNTSGFLPEEREWVSHFLKKGFVDTFRHFSQEPDNYSWWSYRANARNNNKGWRIDYFFATESLQEKLTDCKILPDVKHSDHCPVRLEMEV
ncbi:MAG: exodeoxyribonuclease-3 [Flammeovirgaceae bacterium]|jgi:exodeoxyribonuclease-3